MYNYTPYRSVEYVNGRSSVDLYYLPPNSSVILMDSSEPKFYLKRTDAAGAAEVRAYTFTEVVESTEPQYITRAEWEAWRQQHESHPEPNPAAQPAEQATQYQGVPTAVDTGCGSYPA